MTLKLFLLVCTALVMPTLPVEAHSPPPSPRKREVVSNQEPDWLVIGTPEQEKRGSPFLLWGKNTREAIQQTRNLNGQRIIDLEFYMRPGKNSVVGFLGKEEKLLEILVEDNECVLSMGLTHQILALHLSQLIQKGHASILQKRSEHEEEGRKGSPPSFSIVDHEGSKFEVKELGVFISQYDTPFKDGDYPSIDFQIRNIETGKKFSVSSSHVRMIGRYGFYEGRGTPFRADPRDIAETFSFLKRQKTPQDADCGPLEKEVLTLKALLIGMRDGVDYDFHARVSVSNRLSRLPFEEIKKLLPEIENLITIEQFTRPFRRSPDLVFGCLEGVISHATKAPDFKSSTVLLRKKVESTLAELRKREDFEQSAAEMEKLLNQLK